MSGPHVKLFSEKRGDQVVYEGIAGGPMLDYLAEHGPTWGIAESQTLRMTGMFRPDGDWYTIDQDRGGASGYGAAALNRMAEPPCPNCAHPPHGNTVCGYAITETVRDDVGIFARPSGMVRTDIVGTCGCSPERTLRTYVIAELDEVLAEMRSPMNTGLIAAAKIRHLQTVLAAWPNVTYYGETK